ncbi:MAG TPA: ATP-binding protein, partial [Blastocatellia bacterium]|nr:ATP-binding protein [Blastocatellia bacterium]
VHEISEKVVGERRLVALRDLGALVDAKTAEKACVVVAETLSKHPKDIPFALLYLIDPDGQQARLAGAAGVTQGGPVSPLIIELGEYTHDQQAWPLAEAVRTETMQVVENLAARFGEVVPSGPWSDPPQQAVVAPIRSNMGRHLAGLFVVGVSSRLRLDESYRSFIELAASQIATAIANARAYEEERKRAEALAEIDRAKTEFFSNVSHEFRTPITLMLGPLEDAIADESTPDAVRGRLKTAHRNSLRLLKLVNTLLDFSRIEADRAEAVYEPTDLSALTSEFASVFRSTIENAGMRLEVDCPPLGEVVWVDHGMWEKVVLNLLSNAFKFTFAGAIEVKAHRRGDQAELQVRDTGTGIPEAELPHIFERFHRVKGARGRSYEGSGIGLALVRELVKLHGGSVRVESRMDQGSAFFITIPFGKAHLPTDRVNRANAQAVGRLKGLAVGQNERAERKLVSTAISAQAFVEEARQWLPSETERQREGGTKRREIATQSLSVSPSPHPWVPPSSARILLADDNADMRDYVRNLLSRQYEVVAVNDGLAALEAAREDRFDLLLTDVMMPGLDGFGLLRELRADNRTREIPVILLSARAGEDSKIEGLAAGVDDYLIKPFSARELLARVEAHLKLQRLRREGAEALRESEERFRTLSDSVPALIWLNSPTGCEFVNREYLEFLGVDEAEALGYKWAEFVHPDDREAYVNAYLEAASDRRRFDAEFRFRRHDGEYRWIRSVGMPRFEGSEFKGYVGSSSDIHERKLAEKALAQMAAIVESSEDAIISKDLNGVILSWNKGAEKLFGYRAAEAIGKSIAILIPPERMSEEPQILERIRRGERINHYETVRRRKDGHEIDISLTLSPIRDKSGKIIGASKIARDITERKRVEIERELLLLKESEARAEAEAARSEAEAANRSKDEFLAIVSHELRSPLNAILGYNSMLREKPADEAQLKHCCDVIDRNARTQLQLIEDLLDTTRIVSGKLRLESRRLDINPVLADAFDMMRPAAESKGIQLRIVDCGWRMADEDDTEREGSSIADPQTAIVLGDAARLQQIVWNLLSNAIKFTSAGGRVELRVERTEDHIRIIVTDTGKGIHPEFLTRIFDRFRQADSSSAQRYGGLGLGLSLVKHLTELHGGKVEATSAGQGCGATFIVTLPLATRQESVAEESPALAALAATNANFDGETRTNVGISLPEDLTIAGLRVLVVDDQEEARFLLADFLNRCGADVLAVSSGAEALALLSNTPVGELPDILICDIAMPEEDGYAALRRVRALEEARGVAAEEQIPALALTALAGMEERLRVLSSGFRGYVAKPADPAELMLVIANIAGMWRRKEH